MTADLVPGTTFGPYVVASLLGSGGMGEVYRARDSRLDREVALKVIRADACADPMRRRRFETEARAAAKLSHPNIVSVYDVGEAGGVSYLVSEIVSGGTLADRLQKGPLPLEEVMSIASTIADALAEAHRQGVVHRDLKPGNILLTGSGQPKIADFGLAKCFESADVASEAVTETHEGTVMGTPAYMSPEQAAGQRTDFRSDQFSFALLVIEMVTGRCAFARTSRAETLKAVLAEEVDYDELRRLLPAATVDILRRCLEKDPERRYALTAELAHELRNVAPASAGGKITPAKAAATLFVILAAIVVIARWPRAPEAPRVETLAILPFRNVNADPALAHFGLGLADAMIGRLAAVEGLTVRPTSAIARYESGAVDASEAGRALGVHAILDGTFQRMGATTRVRAQLTDIASGGTMWSNTIDAREGELFKLQDVVSTEIADALRLRLTPAQRQATPRMEAVPDDIMQEYLRVRGDATLFTRSADVRRDTLDRLNGILARAPAFAPALAMRAYALALESFFEPTQRLTERALADADRALALDPTLVEARLARARILYSSTGGWKIFDALREVRAAVAAAPSSEIAVSQLAVLERHLGRDAALLERIAEWRRINPQNPDLPRQTAMAYLGMGKCREALAGFAAAGPISQDVFPLWQQLAHARLQCGERAEVLEELKVRVREMSPAAPDSAMTLALYALAKVLVERSDVTAIEKDAVSRDQRSGHFHHVLFALAEVHAQQGDVAAAMDYLRRAADTGFPCISCFESDPLLSGIRTWPAYTAFIAELRERDAGNP